MKHLTIIILAFTFISCSASKNIEKRMNQYIGWKKHEIIRAWGEPDKDGYVDGVGKVLGYSKYKTGPFGSAYYENTVFFLDADYRVDGWRVNRDPVPVDRLDIRIWRF